MKPETVHDALNDLSEELVQPVERLRNRRRPKGKALRWAGLAACICAAVAAVFVPLFGGAPRAVAAENLMEGVTADPVAATVDLRTDSAAISDFAVRLFQSGMEEGKNTLVSPLSVLCALAMTANGAEGETLAQMEETLGLDVDTLNGWLHTYLQTLPQSEKTTLNLANSIWFKQDEKFAIEQDFLQTNADYYGAALYGAPFDDTTLRDINGWVEEHTAGRIPGILPELDPEAVMVLVNALAFDGEWDEIYNERQVRESVFTTEHGKIKEVDMMHNSEYAYLEDENATGFLKYYEGGQYAFAALLPDEGVTVAEYAASLTGEGLWRTLLSVSREKVITAIPKFETETTLELSDALKSMGMPKAFDDVLAELYGIGNYAGESLYISKVQHKTFIKVDEKGTEAGAATAVEVNPTESAPPKEEPKTVILDRPFLYLLIDCHTNTPFFIGSMMNPTV